MTACRTEEWGDPSWTPIRPQPTTVARVPGPNLVVIMMVMVVKRMMVRMVMLVDAHSTPTHYCC